MILANGILILPDRLVPNGWISFSEEGLIQGLGSGHPPADPISVDLRKCFIAPGFIDLHIHGAGGRDTMDATADAFSTIAAYHTSGGTTSLALTTIPASQDQTIAVLKAARAFPNSHAGARVLGIHLEGPFLSVEKRGAHRAELLHAPTNREETDSYLGFSELITQMTLAPELDGALELITQLAKLGIIASAGHSDCWAADAEAAYVCGLTQLTHTYNCMSSARRQGLFREAGLLEYGLAEPGIVCELIADGKHVSPTLMRALYRAKGADGIILITDATAGAGLAEDEHYSLGGNDCVVRDGVGLLADGSALAGSTCRMIDGIRNLVNLAEVPLPEAVQMATLNPAKALRRENEIGRLNPGARADLVVFSNDFVVRQTWVGGRIVFEG